MQQNDDKSLKSTTRPRLARTRFVGMDPAQQTTGPLPNTDDLALDRSGAVAEQPASPQTPTAKRAALSLLPSALLKKNWNAPLEEESTGHLMQLSGMMRAVRAPGSNTAPLPLLTAAGAVEENGYWPLGIQQTGPLSVRNLYGREPFGRTLPQAVPLVMSDGAEQVQLPLQRLLRTPACKISLGLLVGVVLLFLVTRFINLAQTLLILQAHLATPQGIALALLAGLIYFIAHSLRGLRWQLFLNPIARISTLKVIELYQVAGFLNFLLPMRAGEAAKSLALKRIANVPISKSLPTVAMDRALDLAIVLVIMALAPVLGIRMDLPLWLVFGLVGLVLLGLILFIALTIWKRAFAIALLRRSLGFLPSVLSHKIEGFVTGFVDALLAGASRPAIFLPALLLTCLAVICDGLFAMLAFSTIGLPISFGTALFGYTVYNLFYILPTPPGQIGSNELVGLLVFAGLLRLPGNNVIAMCLFFHPWMALLLAAVGLGCLSALGLTISRAVGEQNEQADIHISQ